MVPNANAIERLASGDNVMGKLALAVFRTMPIIVDGTRWYLMPMPMQLED
jgi:hypothetical protein